MSQVTFEVSQKYENMKGVYEVLAIDGDVMRIRWQDGKEVTTTVTLQSQIIKRMQQEDKELKGKLLKDKELKKAKGPTKRRKAKAAAKKTTVKASAPKEPPAKN